MTKTLPLVPTTSFSYSVNFSLKLGIFSNNSTNLAALEKSAYFSNNSAFNFF